MKSLALFNSRVWVWGFDIRVSIFSARSLGLSFWQRRAVCLWMAISFVPGISVAITGQLQSMASIMTWGRPS